MVNHTGKEGHSFSLTPWYCSAVGLPHRCLKPYGGIYFMQSQQVIREAEERWEFLWNDRSLGPLHFTHLRMKVSVNYGFLHGRVDWILTNKGMWSPVLTFLYFHLSLLFWYPSITSKSLLPSYHNQFCSPWELAHWLLLLIIAVCSLSSTTIVI